MIMNTEKVLIIGAGEAGRELHRELLKHFSQRFQVVGYLDDDNDLIGKSVGGILVLGSISQLSLFVKKFNVSEVFIAIPSAQGSLIREVIKSCEKQKVIFKIVPRLLEIVEGKVKLSQVRNIEVNDLLGRALVKTDQRILAEEFKGKTVFLSGAAGSIGSEISRQILQFNPKKIIAFDCWESGLYNLNLDVTNQGNKNKLECVVGNIQDYPKLERVIKFFHPDVIFHAAAYKHVPLMQKYPEEAVKNNIFGTENLVKAALAQRVKKFINISTDKAVDPTSIMGTTKLIAEKIISQANQSGITKFCSVRFGNVLDSQGSVVPTFKKQIAQGGPVTITHKDMTRYFMTIPEAVQLVLNASLLVKEGGEIFVLDMGEPVKIAELANLMIRLAGFIPEKEIPIKYVGIRPGEKMNEKLTMAHEAMRKTNHSKIFVIKPDLQMVNITDLLDDFRSAIIQNEKEIILQLLKTAAPNLKKLG